MNLNAQSIEIDTTVSSRNRKLSLYDIVFYIQKILIQMDVELINKSLKQAILMTLCMINKIAPHMKGLLHNMISNNQSKLNLVYSDFSHENHDILQSLKELFQQQCIHAYNFSIIELGTLFQSLSIDTNAMNHQQFQATSLLYNCLQIPKGLKLKFLKCSDSNKFTLSILNELSYQNNLNSYIKSLSPLDFQYQNELPVALKDLITQIKRISTIEGMNVIPNNKQVGSYLLPTKYAYNLPTDSYGNTNNTSHSKSSMVATHTTICNLNQLAQAVLSELPIIVQGNCSSGKSFLIKELAITMNRLEDIIELHINDQTDCKTLIGSYVCSDIPGEFIWQAGVLTQAVLTGKWVVIENIDMVPIEFIASISSLLSRRRIYLPHRNAEVTAHPSFRLFGTRAVLIPEIPTNQINNNINSNNSSSSGSSSNNLQTLFWDSNSMIDYNNLIYIPTMQHFSYLFHYVHIHDLKLNEIEDILVTQYPMILPVLINKLLSIYIHLNNHHINNTSNHNNDNHKNKNSNNSNHKIKQNSLNKKFALREILKVASRISCNCGEFNITSGYLTNEQKILSFKEIVDVFAGSIRNREKYEEVLLELGTLWGVNESEIHTHFFNSINSNNKSITTNNINKISNDVIKHMNESMKIGRVVLQMPSTSLAIQAHYIYNIREQNFAFTKYSLRLLEQVSVCVSRNEPVLLVGETGTGKTTSVQELADLLHKKLIVQNLSLSTDVSDLLGGYCPVTMKQLFTPIFESFIKLFHETLSSSQNNEFLTIVSKFYQAQSWRKLIKAFIKASSSAIQKLNKGLSTITSDSVVSNSITKDEKKRLNYITNIERWNLFKKQMIRYEANLTKIEFGFAFSFIDGLLVEALYNGHWVLLDEINLASSETLQGLSGILDSSATLFLTDKESGELKPMQRHPEFRIFAAMNPPTDVGKRELPPSLSSRFTELYCEELIDPIDLQVIAERYLGGITSSVTIISDIVSVYLGCRAASEDHLTDSAGQRPRYSLRSLTRSLQASKSFLSIGIRPLTRALFESFLLNFQTLLSESSREYMYTYLKHSLYSEGSQKDMNMPPTRPDKKKTTGEDWILVKPFWLTSGALPPIDWAIKDEKGMIRFVLTKTVERNIRCLAASISARVAPILIQGPTSIGKTSMIEYLAARCGYKCVRINNHEHTDVQEYIGGYITNSSGQLEFKDGLLVEALREGHWIILDELNLAPSDVLEALNRLLDDNKELLIPETGEIIKPAPGFTLFATQNPPGIYGGRKPLSRAFKNRFLELSVSDLPLPEVEEIVTQSCGIAPKFSQMLVKTMQELQIHRQKSTLFQGKYGVITTRDLIKWGRRLPNSALEVATEGYMLLAEKLRSSEEKQLIVDILNKVCKTQFNPSILYRSVLSSTVTVKSIGTTVHEHLFIPLSDIQELIRSNQLYVEGMQNIAITYSMLRIWELINRSLKQNEPILLIGDTGSGKTTVCQLYAAHKNQTIRILNCHQSTETSDLIGGLRPVRGREAMKLALVEDIRLLLHQLSAEMKIQSDESLNTLELDVNNMNVKLLYDILRDRGHLSIDNLDEILLKSCLDEIFEYISKVTIEEESTSPLKRLKIDDKSKIKGSTESLSGSNKYTELSIVLSRAQMNWQRCRSLFEWQDGPLITAMKEGDVFVMDEINLAEDSVIERLNSVLESGRTITLAEKGGMSSELIIAHPHFKILATMNPGGDFGKRELSPALRSRFTEIWVPGATDPADVKLILKEILSFPNIQSTSEEILSDLNSKTSPDNINDYLSDVISSLIIQFMIWTNEQSAIWLVDGIHVSVREILAWAKFITQSLPTCITDVYVSYIHGAFMIILDGLGIGIAIPREKIRQFKNDCLTYLISQCPSNIACNICTDTFFLSTVSLPRMIKTDHHFLVGSFSIDLGSLIDISIQSIPEDSMITMDSELIKPFFQQHEYVLNAKITTLNLGRIMRAMQLPRAILLEGPPGVGKSSLIANLAAMTGHKLVRINLSEHSELSDLLGTDLPTSTIDEEISSNGSSTLMNSGSNNDDDNNNNQTSIENKKNTNQNPQFKWSDGVFLTAMKQGHWVLLDELNLAPQSVLEGLNACFDHRHEVFLPDIDQTVTCPPSFRVFCAQNPMVEGGGRKGLPQSFLSRFSRVFIEAMTDEDLLEIVSHAFNIIPSTTAIEDENNNTIIDSKVPQLDSKIPIELIPFIPSMVQFIQLLQHNIVELGIFGHSGGPWEFNLRDIFRWCELIISLQLNISKLKSNYLEYIISTSAYILFVRRMRTSEDRYKLCIEFEKVFHFPLLIDIAPIIEIKSIKDIKEISIYSLYLTVGTAIEPIILNSRYFQRNEKLCDVILNLIHSDANLMQGLSKTLECLLHCITLKWPVLLVGPYGSGKHRALQYLAEQTGHLIEHFSVSPSTDSTELLGSFEQINGSRHLIVCINYLQSSCMLLTNATLRMISKKQTQYLSSFTFHCIQVLNRLKLIYEQSVHVIEYNELNLSSGKKLIEDIQLLINILWNISSQESLFTLIPEVNDIKSMLEDVLKEIRYSIKYCTGGEGISGFEWVDGVIIRAVQEGKWLVIDNINLCSASVLDRLNSLLEPNGTLLLTESGGIGRIITPHKDFRVFFCMDASFGEISRAMRNRCVEIAILPIDVDNKVTISKFITNSQGFSIEVIEKMKQVCDSLGFFEKMSIISYALPSTSNLNIIKIPVHFPKYQLYQRIIQFYNLNQLHGKSIEESLLIAVEFVLPGYYSKRINHHAVNNSTDTSMTSTVSDSKIELYFQDLYTLLNSSYISQNLYMSMYLLGEVLQHENCPLSASNTATTNNNNTWIEGILHQSERKHIEPYVLFNEYINKIKQLFIHDIDVSYDSKLPKLVLIMNHIVYLTFNSEVSWIQEVLLSVFEKINIAKQYMFWLQKYQQLMNLFILPMSTTSIDINISNKIKDILLITMISSRCMILDKEQQCFELIEQYSSSSQQVVLSNLRSATTTTTLSMYSVALGIKSELFTSDSRELSMLSAIFQIVSTMDGFLNKYIIHIYHTYNELYIDIKLKLLRELFLKRDILAHVLCNNNYNLLHASTQKFPWDEISICTNWLKKYIKYINQSYINEFAIIDIDSHDMITICESVESDLVRFDRAVCAYWHRPLLQQKLRLWKEGGHAAVPSIASHWKLFNELRNVVEAITKKLEHINFTETSIKKKSITTNYQTCKAHFLLKEWLSLYSTFYWLHTEEDICLVKQQLSDSSTSIKYSHVIKNNKPTLDISTLIQALNEKFLLFIKDTTLDEISIQDTMECFDYDDGTAVGLQYTSNVHSHIARERNCAGEQSVGVLIESIVIRNILVISNELSRLYLILSSSSKDTLDIAILKGLHSLCIQTIDITVRYTSILTPWLRELQSLSWAIEAVIANDNQKASIKYASKVQSLIQLLRVFIVTLETKLFKIISFNQSNYLQTINVSYNSPTLSLLLNCNSVTSLSTYVEAINQRIEVPWQQSIYSGVTRTFQPIYLEVISKYIDIQTICSRYQDISGRVMRLFSYDTAAVTISAYQVARKRMLQLTRLTAAISLMDPNMLTDTTNLNTTDTILDRSNSTDLLLRLNQISVYILDVIKSCRDFYPSHIKSQLLELFSRSTSSYSAIERFEPIKILNLGSLINNSLVANLFTYCLQPVLLILTSYEANNNKYNKETKTHNSEKLSMYEVGKAWIYTGLLRIHLLLPTMPVDPATKPAIKAQLLELNNEVLYDSMYASYIQNAYAEIPLVTPQIITNLLKFNEEKINIERLHNQGIVRPTINYTTSFVDLYEEIKSATDGFLELMKILEFINKLDNIQNNKTKISTFYLNNINHNDMLSQCNALLEDIKVLIHEELSLQAIIFSFIERLEMNYSIYEDITSTIISAVSNLSIGLRTTVGCLYQEVKGIVREHRTTINQKKQQLTTTTTLEQYQDSAIVIEEEDCTKMWVDVMQYPFSLQIPLHYSNNNSNKDIFDIILFKQHLLKPVVHLLNGLKSVYARALENIAIYSTEPMEASRRVLESSIVVSIPDATTIETITPHIVLLHALSRIEYLVTGQSIDLFDVYDVFIATLDKFVSSYLKGIDEKRRTDDEKASLYRSKNNRGEEKVFESNYLKEEEAALKINFPDYLEQEFRSIPGILKDEIELNNTNDLVVANKSLLDNNANDEMDINANNTIEPLVGDIELYQSFDESITKEVVGFHARIVFIDLIQQYSYKQTQHSNGLMISNGCIYHPKKYNTNNISSNNNNDEEDVFLQQLLSPNSNDANHFIQSKFRLQNMLAKNTLVTMKSLNLALLGIIAPQLDQQLRGTSLMSLSMMIQQCSSGNSNKFMNKIERSSSRSTHKIDRDLLLLLDIESDPIATTSKSKTSSSSTIEECKPIDFHKDPNPKESIRATEILQKLFDRSSELLAQFPGNELLLQVCKISSKISEFHITTSIGKLLISLQLLLQKAEEWELFAAKHVSLRDEMNILCKLIADWRELELKSWETLLRSKEITYVYKAEMHWYTLMRMLTSIPIVQKDIYVDNHPSSMNSSNTNNSTATNNNNHWNTLEEVSPVWLNINYKTPIDKYIQSKNNQEELSEHMKWKNEMIDQKEKEMMTESEYLLKIFNTLESFLRLSCIGEFPTRLHLIRLFGLQLLLECKLNHKNNNDLSNTNTTNEKQSKKQKRNHKKKTNQSCDMNELKLKLANIVTAIWRHFEQFLPLMRQFQDLLKDPIQTRLKGEVKIGKWDQLNTYALIEYSEKIHRKLNKFLLEYQNDVLDYPIAAIIRKEVMDDFVNKANELQVVHVVPNLNTICPALYIWKDQKTETEAYIFILSEDMNHKLHNNNITSNKNNLILLNTSKIAPTMKEKFQRIFNTDMYVNKIKKYFKDILTPSYHKVDIIPIKEVINKNEIQNKNVLITNEEDITATTVTSAITTTTNVLSFYQKVCYGLQGSLIAEEISLDIFYRIESLQQDKVPKPTKQRAVRDLLQVLRDHGISHLRSTVSDEVRHNVEVFSMNTPIACEFIANLTWNSNEPRNLFEKGEVYYYRNITEITQLRTQAKSIYSSDVSPRDTVIMSGLSENLLVEVMKLRCTISASLYDLQQFHQVANHLQEATSVMSLSFHKLSNPTSIYPTSTATAIDDNTHKRGVMNQLKKIKLSIKNNHLIAQVMLDNLIQLSFILETIALAHESQNIEEDCPLESLEPTKIKRTITNLNSIIHLITQILIKQQQQKQSSSANQAVIHSNCIGMLTLYNNTNAISCNLDININILKKDYELIHESMIIFNECEQYKYMCNLASIDVVSGIKSRFLEIHTQIYENYIKVDQYSINNDDLVDNINDIKDNKDSNHINDQEVNLDKLTVFGNLVSSCIDHCLVTVQKLRNAADITNITELKGCYGEDIQTLTNQSTLMNTSLTMNNVDNVDNNHIDDTANNDVIEDKNEKFVHESNLYETLRLQECMVLSVTSLSIFQLHKITNDLMNIYNYYIQMDGSLSIEEQKLYCLFVQSLQPIYKLITNAFTTLLEGVIQEYKSIGKLLYIVLRIFRTILAKGICSAEQMENGDDDPGSGDLSGMLFQDNLDGTGMGEGEGKKDVSDQIENEEQLLGLKDDKPKENEKNNKQPEKKQLNKEEKDQGVEMTQDFEGEMFDIPSDDEENKDNNSEDEDNKSEELEKEMGDANLDDIVDEKQWNEDEDSLNDNNEQDNEKEKFEKDSKMQGNAIEGEMRTKDNKDEDDGGDDKKEDSKSKKDENKNTDIDKDNSNNEDKINEDIDNDTQKPMGVDVRPEEKENNKDNEDNNQDNKDEDNNIEDNIEDIEENDGDAGSETKGDQGKEQDKDDSNQQDKDVDGKENFPDDMNIGDDEDHVADDDNLLNENENNIDENNQENNEQPNNLSDEKDEEDEEKSNIENTGITGSSGDLPEQNNEEPEIPELEDQAEDNMNIDNNDNDNIPKQATFGIRNEKGNEALLNNQDDDNTNNEKDNASDDISKQKQNQDPSAMKAQQPQGKGGVSQGESKDGLSHEIGGVHRDDPPPTSSKTKSKEPPNPFKNPGDINEKWHRRLNLVLPIDDDDEEDTNTNNIENDDQKGNDDEILDGGGKGLYEHASKEEGAYEQVLADAPEDQAVQLPDYNQSSKNNDDTNENILNDDTDVNKLNKHDEDDEGERKRDRDSNNQDDYKGHKAKKKRFNDDNEKKPSIDNPIESMQYNSEEVEDMIDEDNLDIINNHEDKDNSIEQTIIEDKEDRNKIITKDSFQFGTLSNNLLKSNHEAIDANDDIEKDIELIMDQNELILQTSSFIQGRLIWQQHRNATDSYSMRLCEQLRVILEPSLATRLKGDYRTGKRINMRKVIPYVASGFRKDKIWLRRTKPAKRAYQVMIMIDDSSSMGLAGPLALSSLATIATALTRLEIGELSIVSFAEKVRVLHKFGIPFTDEAGAKVVSQFDFKATSTMLSSSLNAIQTIFQQARNNVQSQSNSTSTTVLQLCFVISDARIDSDNRQNLESTIRMLSEQNILVVLVIIDRNNDPKDSIFNTRSVSFIDNKVITKSYFDDFPFPYYVAIQQVEVLPDILADALKQWFELIRIQMSNH